MEVCMNTACAWPEKKHLVYENQKQIENERKKITKKATKQNAMRQKTKGELMKNTNRERKKGKEKNMNSLYASMSLRRFLDGKKMSKFSCAVEC